MTIIDLLLTAVALSMDALAVSITKGIALDQKNNFKSALKVGIYFGGFQALMPTVGYLLGSSIHGEIKALDHWVAFGLLVFIGVKMILDARKENDAQEQTGNPVSAMVLLPLAVATSIDALAVGISLAMVNTNLPFSVFTIGLVTLLICTLGVLLGKPLSRILKNKAGFIGGMMLVFIGIKILIEHISGGI